MLSHTTKGLIVMKENKNVEELKERLLYRKRSLFESEGAETVSAAMSFAEDYKAWLDPQRPSVRQRVRWSRCCALPVFRNTASETP